MHEEQIREILERMLDSGESPEDACADHPEWLASVTEQWLQLRRVEGQLESLFPSGRSKSHSTGHLPTIAGHTAEAVLGSGGMGVVYKARHNRLNRTVAIKMLLVGAQAKPDEVACLLREAQAVAGLRHPHIVQVYEVGEADGLPYFTMEYMDGGSLAHKMAGTPQPPRDAAQLVATLADAVQAAHDGKVVHRDLKPANILLAGDGTPKIADFSLARRFEGADDLTLSSAAVGTPSYMAPEQAAGTAAAFCPAVDIYALGALLYDMLTGRPPFKAHTPAETQRQVLHEAPAAPSALNTRVPRDLETICLTCLSKDPARRYSTAAALADDLRRFLDGKPISARPVGEAERTIRWIRRNPTLAALIAAILVLAVLAGAFATRELAEASRRREEMANWAARLEFIVQLQRDGRFHEARAILGRVPDAGSRHLRADIDRATRELELVETLEAIRMDRAMASTADFARADFDARYKHAFETAGIMTDADDPQFVADRINALTVRAAVVAALDEWTICTNHAPMRERLMIIARLADPDPWGDRARDVYAWFDADAVHALAAEVGNTRQSPGLLMIVAGLLDHHGRDDLAFLRRAHEAHPDDFWITFNLAETIQRVDPAEAVGFYRAAIALRPGAVAAHVNLGLALQQAGRLADARRALQRATEVEPSSAISFQNLALADLQDDDAPAAERHARRAIELDPTSAIAMGVLGQALLARGDPAQALLALEQAVAMAAEGSHAHQVSMAHLVRCRELIAHEADSP
jgi:serine/threonine-protein kinase